MATAAGAIAGIGIGAVLVGAVKAASDLNETVNKTNVIFGDNASAVREWASDSARSFGLSQQAALEAASGFGNMLQQLGFTGDEALKASTNTVKLAADLGSFNNLETGDVLERIGGALRGEYDSLQLLIPNINAARVEQEAMAETGKANADQLTAQEKAAATLAIVQRDGASAADDFAETSDGLANSQKILTAEWEDAQAQLGDLLVGPMTGLVNLVSTSLIPAFETVVGTVGDAVDAFADLPGPVQATLGVVAGLIAFKGPLSGLFTALGGVAETAALKLLYAKDAIAGVSSVSGAAKAGLGGLVSLLGGPWGVVIAASVGSFALLSSVTEENEKVTTDATDAQRTFADALRESNGVIDDNVRRSAAKAAQDAGILDVAEDAGISLSTVTDALLGNSDAYDEVSASLEEYAGLQSFAAAFEEHGSTTLHDQADAAHGAVDAFDLLSGTLAETSTEQGQLDEAAAATGDAMDASTEQTDEATKALEDWLKQLQGVAEGFVEPLDTYKDLLSQKQQAEQDSAAATAAATDDASDSWEDYVTDVEVSLDEYAATLEEQIANQDNWRDNLVTVAQRAGADVAQALADMGADGIDLTAAMADGTDAEVQRMAEAIRADIQHGSADWTADLDTAMNVMSAIGTAGAHATVNGIATELGIGAETVRQIAAQYGVHLAEGVNPLLLSLGKPVINVAASRPGGAQAAFNADGNVYERHDAEIASAGAWRVWAEPETGGEAYIPLSPSKRARSVDIWQETGRLLGQYADGGFASVGSVPRPPSTSPYGPPISSGGDAVMQKAYDETAAWVTANAATMFGGDSGIGINTGPIAEIVRSVANAYGWGSGAEWDALSWIINHESGFRPTAQNPTSTAYGLFQFLDGTWSGTGIGKTSDPRLQSVAGMRYIGSRYGDPLGAQGFWMRNGWYDQGGWLQPGYTMAYNGTGKPERVVGPNSPTPVGSAARGGPMVVKVVTPDLRGIAIRGHVTFDKNGIATIAGDVVDQKFGELHDAIEYSS